tara:strand:+ start:555 stop:827 length:273 start_codon:yes stop_codon:yes gene_type:complete
MTSKEKKEYEGKIADPELEEYKLAKTKFTCGKHKGLTYEEVRENHTEYFGYLFSQPVYQVYKYIDFIKYCFDFLKVEALWDEDFIEEFNN